MFSPVITSFVASGLNSLKICAVLMVTSFPKTCCDMRSKHTKKYIRSSVLTVIVFMILSWNKTKNVNQVQCVYVCVYWDNPLFIPSTDHCITPQSVPNAGCQDMTLKGGSLLCRQLSQSKKRGLSCLTNRERNLLCRMRRNKQVWFMRRKTALDCGWLRFDLIKS